MNFTPPWVVLIVEEQLGGENAMLDASGPEKEALGSEGWKWTPGKMEMVGPGVMANSVFAGEGHQNACPCQIFVAF